MDDISKKNRDTSGVSVCVYACVIYHFLLPNRLLHRKCFARRAAQHQTRQRNELIIICLFK